MVSPVISAMKIDVKETVTRFVDGASQVLESAEWHAVRSHQDVAGKKRSPLGGATFHKLEDHQPYELTPELHGANHNAETAAADPTREKRLHGVAGNC